MWYKRTSEANVYRDIITSSIRAALTFAGTAFWRLRWNKVGIDLSIQKGLIHSFYTVATVSSESQMDLNWFEIELLFNYPAQWLYMKLIDYRERLSVAKSLQQRETGVNRWEEDC